MKIFQFIFLLIFVSAGFSIHGQTLKNFSFIYENDGGSYNSLTKIFTKDMGRDPSVSCNIRLTKKERKTIFEKMIQIDFWNYPETYKYVNADSTSKRFGMTEPCSGWKFIAYDKQSTKTVKWSNCIIGNVSKERKYEKLMELKRLVEQILSQKPEYKKLPSSRYLRY